MPTQYPMQMNASGMPQISQDYEKRRQMNRQMARAGATPQTQDSGMVAAPMPQMPDLSQMMGVAKEAKDRQRQEEEIKKKQEEASKSQTQPTFQQSQSQVSPQIQQTYQQPQQVDQTPQQQYQPIEQQPTLASTQAAQPADFGKDVVITSRANEQYLGNQINRGTDFSAPPDSPVYLPEGNWKVLSSRNDITQRAPNNHTEAMNYGWGNSVEVQNELTGEKMRMSHMAPGSVKDLKQGEILLGGVQIGAVGNTGNTHGDTGYHLDTEYYDPQGKRLDVAQTPYAQQLLKRAENSTMQKPLTQQEETNVVSTLSDLQGPKPPDQQTESILTKPQLTPETSLLNEKTKVIDTKQYDSYMSKVPQSGQEASKKSVPLIVDALKKEGIDDPNTVAYALATVEHETAGTMSPIEEYSGREQARRLGYEGGEDYFGRGFIQLTHKGNYEKMGERIGVPDLAQNPEKALEPETSAKILAAFFKDRGVSDRASKGDFYGARGPVNGTDKVNEVAQLAQKYLQN